MIAIFADHCVGKSFIEPLRQSGFEIDRLSRETIQKRIANFFQSNSAPRLKGRLFVIDLGGAINVWPKL